MPSGVPSIQHTPPRSGHVSTRITSKDGPCSRMRLRVRRLAVGRALIVTVMLYAPLRGHLCGQHPQHPTKGHCPTHAHGYTAGVCLITGVDKGGFAKGPAYFECFLAHHCYNIPHKEVLVKRFFKKVLARRRLHPACQPYKTRLKRNP